MEEHVMSEKLVAKADVTIDAPDDEVWESLVDPEAIREYMFGTTVVSDWREGSPIVWKGEWQGRKYEDKGTILELDAPRRLRYSHFSPLAGKEDTPENYHTVTIALTPEGDRTRVTLSQDNNATAQERAHSEENWTTMLQGLKAHVER
jgi:uncharacterized protein YndB with AHSA1/START domain